MFSFDFSRGPAVRPPVAPAAPVRPQVIFQQPAAPASYWDRIVNFGARTTTYIRTNTWAAVAVFTGVNVGLLSVANKVNAYAAGYVQQLDTERKKFIATQSITASVVFVGNFVAAKALKYPLSGLQLAAITVGVVSAKLFYEVGPAYIKKFIEDHKTKTV